MKTCTNCSKCRNRDRSIEHSCASKKINQKTESTKDRTMTLPHVIELNVQSPQEFISYYQENEKKIEEELLSHGAIKFKNVSIDGANDFQKIVGSLSENRSSYIHGNSPRKQLSSNVFTSTEHDKSQVITMHNEMSYCASWPKRLFLSCINVSETGGETLLADSRDILKSMNPDIVEAVRTKGVKYIRNLHGGNGFFGKSWQETYQTDDRATAEKYMNEAQIEYKWKDDGSLRIIENREGVYPHPVTNELVWFNQIEHFHPCHLGDEIYEVIQSVYDSPMDYPMYVQYGDGSPIEVDVIKEIVETIDSLTIAPKWEKNEFLIVDNEMICHGRNPYTGERLVLVTMS